jgi:rod shape determining protein RodA
MSRSGPAKIDWLSIIIFLLLVVFGWMNIYSASVSGEGSGFFDLNHIYGKQALWISLSFVLIILIFAIEAKFFERFASVFYLVSLISLAGLFVFGNTVSGATSWYNFGGISIQPGEFAKAATALALAKYLSDIETNIGSIKQQFYAFLIILLPAILIIPQPDPGSALVYVAFLFPLYREGISTVYLLVGLSVVALFIATLLIGSLYTSIIAGVLVLVAMVLQARKRIKHYLIYFFILLFSIGFSFSVNYIFENFMEQRHRDRINLILGRDVDNQGIGYNINQSKIAIGSGGWTGKGWTEGTQTRGGFVPEQHTDYIFSTVGEEWGFLGTSVVVLLFIVLLVRLAFVAERQRSVFARVYGYCVVGILFVHFLINIGMVIGVFPTVGIPLPFFSYGGSSLWGFTILLFVFLKLDSQRKNVMG